MRKTWKKTGAIFFALCYLVAAVACSGMADMGGGGYGGYYTGGTMTEGAGAMEDAAPDAAEGEENEGESTSEEVVKKPAGLITAGAWNDNDNYAYWKTLFEQGTETNGKFYDYTAQKSWGFTSYNRIKVTVKNGENPVAGAKTVAKDAEGNTLFTAVADANGVAYLFTNETTGSIEVTSGNGNATAEFTAENRELTVDITQNEIKKNVIELMFVVDVTGSMGDELSYLKNEIADVVNKVASADSETQINLALLFYRDHTDQEIFKYYDFVDVTNADGLATQQAAIDAQSASGGGDYEEAVEEALELAVEKQWSSAATTKIIFHVLDAPPHSQSKNQTTYYNAVQAAAEKGIRFCPILCSGANTLTEYLMRQAAIYTGGTFVFITDDSGIGNAHHDPGLPNVTVEALNSLMVRLIKGYHSGTFADPIDWRQDVQDVTIQ